MYVVIPDKLQAGSDAGVVGLTRVCAPRRGNRLRRPLFAAPKLPTKHNDEMSDIPMSCIATKNSLINPFRTPVPFWGHAIQIPSSLSQIVPKTGLRF